MKYLHGSYYAKRAMRRKSSSGAGGAIVVWLILTAVLAGLADQASNVLGIVVVVLMLGVGALAGIGALTGK